MQWLVTYGGDGVVVRKGLGGEDSPHEGRGGAAGRDLRQVGSHVSEQVVSTEAVQ